MRALAVAILLLSIAPARADGLVLAPGQLEARLVTEISLQPLFVGRPISIAPDVWYGLTDRWTLGVTHSNASLDRIDAGASFCVRQLDKVCDRPYRGGAIEARWSWRTGPLSVAPRGRFLLRDVDPAKPALALGALVRWQRGRFSLETDPYLRIGLANTHRGNRTFLMLPLYVMFEPTCRWRVGLHLGWESDLAVWRDGWHGPVGLVVKARATEHLEVMVHGGFTSLVGAQNDHKERAVMLGVGWRTD